MKKAENIDEFIELYPQGTRVILNKIRDTIRTIAPEAKEKISYGIPTFSLNGKNLIHFSAYKTHIGLYPGAQVIINFANELKAYKTSKGTIQFPLDKPIPYELIEKITLHLLK